MPWVRDNLIGHLNRKSWEQGHGLNILFQKCLTNFEFQLPQSLT